MRPEDRNRVSHMIEAAEAVLEFTAGRRASDLASDRMLLFALLRAIEVLGEAASKISPEVQAASDGVPWRPIIATRNRHGYFDIDHGIVLENGNRGDSRLADAIAVSDRKLLVRTLLLGVQSEAMITNYLRYLSIGIALTPVAALFVLIAMMCVGMPVLFLKGYWLLALKLVAPGSIVIMPLARMFFDLGTGGHVDSKWLVILARPRMLHRPGLRTGNQEAVGHYGSPNTITVDDPGAARQKLLAPPDMTATYCFPATA